MNSPRLILWSVETKPRTEAEVSSQHEMLGSARVPRAVLGVPPKTRLPLIRSSLELRPSGVSGGTPTTARGTRALP